MKAIPYGDYQGADDSKPQLTFEFVSQAPDSATSNPTPFDPAQGPSARFQAGVDSIPQGEFFPEEGQGMKSSTPAPRGNDPSGSIY